MKVTPEKRFGRMKLLNVLFSIFHNVNLLRHSLFGELFKKIFKIPSANHPCTSYALHLVNYWLFTGFCAGVLLKNKRTVFGFHIQLIRLNLYIE